MQVSFVRLKRNEAGLYLNAKKRGRPFGTGSFSRKGSKPLIAHTKRSPDEPSKRGGHLGKRKVGQEYDISSVEAYSHYNCRYGLVNKLDDIADLVYIHVITESYQNANTGFWFWCALIPVMAL